MADPFYFLFVMWGGDLISWFLGAVSFMTGMGLGIYMLIVFNLSFDFTFIVLIIVIISKTNIFIIIFLLCRFCGFAVQRHLNYLSRTFKLFYTQSEHTIICVILSIIRIVLKWRTRNTVRWGKKLQQLHRQLILKWKT